MENNKALTEDFVIKSIDDNKINTVWRHHIPRKPIYFTVYGGTVKITNGNQRNIYLLVTCYRINRRRNFKLRIVLINPTTSADYTFHEQVTV